VDLHQRKLRRGAHTGNHFRIVLKNLTETCDVLNERLMQLRHRGVPNYFGEQRFWRDGNNMGLAGDLFAGRRLSRSDRSIALSAARSLFFNHLLEDRVTNGIWNFLLPGDCANFDGNNSFFAVDGVNAEL
jgi:tRNA pseudouridine13 synthase